MNAEVKTRDQEWNLLAPVPTPKVYAAIARVMGEIGKAGISKARKNTQQGYNFRGIDDVYNALSGFLSGAGLCILPRVLGRTVTERTTQKGGVLFYVVLEVEFDIVCAEDGSRHTVAVIGEAMDSGDKATNKAMSAAYKYACMEVFCIPTEGDNDADSTTHEVAPQPVPVMCLSEAADHLAAIEAAADMDSLKGAFTTAYHAAKAIGDTARMAVFENCKNTRKDALSAKAAA